MLYHWPNQNPLAAQALGDLCLLLVERLLGADLFVVEGDDHAGVFDFVDARSDITGLLEGEHVAHERAGGADAEGVSKS